MLKHILLTGMVAFLVSVPSWGQSWQETYQQAQGFYSKDSYDQAFAAAEDALKKYQAESGIANENYAAILRLLSTICYVQEKYSAGLEYLNKELDIRRQRKDTTYAVALANKAHFQAQLGTFDQAVASLLECQQVLREYYKEDDMHVLECNVDIGINYYMLSDFQKATEWLGPLVLKIEQQKIYTEETLPAFYYSGLLQLESGNTTEAVKTFLEAKQLYESKELTATVNYALVLYGLAQSYYRSNMYDKAEESYQAAQTGYEKQAGKDEMYFKILNNRAVNLQIMGKQSEAEELLNQIQKQPQGQAAYASSLSNSAAIYQSNGDYAKAEANYLKALAQYNQGDKESLLSYAETNENLAMMYSEKGDQESALTHLAESRAILEKLFGYYHRKYIAVMNRLGWVLTKKGSLEEAGAAYRQSLQIIEKMLVKPGPEQMTALNGMAVIFQRKGKFHTADSIYQSILQRYDQGFQKDAYYTLALNNLAASRQIQGQLPSACKLLRQRVSATSALKGNMSLPAGDALEDLAGLNLKLGDLSSAKRELDSAVLIFEKTAGKESVEYANGQMDMGRYFQIMGDYTRAEPYLKSARDIIKNKKGDQCPEYASTLNALGLLYQTLGNYREAEPLLKESQSIVEKTQGKINSEYSTALQNLATLYQLENRNDLAEPLLKEALETDKHVLGESHPQYGIILQNLATLYQKSGKRKEAQEMLERVLQTTGQSLGKDHPSYATTLSNLAALYQDEGNFDLAETTWKQSVELRRKILGESHPDYARSLFGLAGVYHARGQLDEALKYYGPVVASYQKQVRDFFPSLSEKEKSAFYIKIKPVFDAYQDFCIQYLMAHPAEQATMLKGLYDLQLSTKAILLNATSKVRSRILASGDKHLQELFREWLSTKEAIVRYYNYSQAEREQQKTDLATLESHANDLEKKLSEQSDAFHTQFDKEIVTWKEVQKALHEKEAAVEIIRIKKKYTVDSVYYVGLVLKNTGDGPELTVWPQGRQLETRRFKYHRNTIKFHFTDTMSYKFFWLPLAQKLQDVSTVFLSCDGVFNKVNFNSLYNTSAKRWVIDDYTLHQVSNTRELAEGPTTSAPAAKPTGCLFGYADFNWGATNVAAGSSQRHAANLYGFEGAEIPVLPATEKEVDEVTRILQTHQWEVQSYKKMEATEENLKKMESPRLVHIATHGFFLSDMEINENDNDELLSNPLFRSGVLLAGASVDRSVSQRAEDGVLTAYEAMNLHLDNTDLVVLSACETGLGEVRNGEGVYGLQRSFLVAGANTVLMSLWQVDDVATQELMDTFYSFWLAGQDKHQAFRKAQLVMKDKYIEPYFWGAFVLIGY